MTAPLPVGGVTSPRGWAAGRNAPSFKNCDMNRLARRDLPPVGTSHRAIFAMAGFAAARRVRFGEFVSLCEPRACLLATSRNPEAYKHDSPSGARLAPRQSGLADRGKGRCRPAAT